MQLNIIMTQKWQKFTTDDLIQIDKHFAMLEEHQRFLFPAKAFRMDSDNNRHCPLQDLDKWIILTLISLFLCVSSSRRQINEHSENLPEGRFICNASIHRAIHNDLQWQKW